MKPLGVKELKEILHKNWMTHDGMWFFHCLRECGIEKTNKINRAAVKSMALMEIRRIREVLGVQRVESFDDFMGFMNGVNEIVKADFMDFVESFPRENVCRVEMKTCFAHEGIKRSGAIDDYQCGIFDRFAGWFEGLGIQYSVHPHVEKCMMHETGDCFREFTLDFGPR
jgi:uncharacterized protein DUF6125